MNNNIIKTQQMLNRLCENLKSLRRIFAVSENEMAKKLGISKEALLQIEDGTVPKDLDIEVLIRIYESFGVTPSEMLETDVCQTVYDILAEHGYNNKGLNHKM